MKLALAQLKLDSGDIDYNVAQHLKAINKAVSNQVNAIFFSELSITAYEPKLANKLAFSFPFDEFDRFQMISNEKDITIGVGVPTKDQEGVKISMLVFSKHSAIRVYSKQHLHPDELSYFIKGNKSILIEVGGIKIAPAICFESLQERHFKKMLDLGADVYLSSVAKSKEGVDAAICYFSELYDEHQVPVLMVNNLGFSDDFYGGGRSSIWYGRSGEEVISLEKEEGLLILDTKNKTAKILPI